MPCRRRALHILLWNLSRWGQNDLESQYHRSDMPLRGYAVVSVADEIPGDAAVIFEALHDSKNRKFMEDISLDTGERCTWS